MRRLADVAYRTLLRAFPEEFRRRHAMSMVEHFGRQREAVRGRPAATVWLWLRAITDALRHGSGARVAGWRARWWRGRSARARHSLLRDRALLGLELARAMRSLGRSPWYSALVPAVLALSLGLVLTVFAVVDGVLFKALPYPQPELLYTASARDERGRGGYPFTADEVGAWRVVVPGLEVASFRIAKNAGTTGDGRMYGAASVDDRFFDVLGQAPLVGGFTREHFQPGSPPVAVISFRLWQQVFGGRPNVIGAELPLAGVVDRRGQPAPRPVVTGILRPSFVFPDWNGMPDVIKPLVLSAAGRADRNESALLALVRRPESMSLVGLQQRLDAAVRSSQPQSGARRLVTGASLEPVSEVGAPYAKQFRNLALVAAFLAVIAIAGIAGLTLARRRQREQDVRLMQALGATKWDLLRQTVFEVGPLVLAGTALGLALSPGALAIVLSQLPVQTPIVTVPRVDGRVAALAAALGATATLLVSLAGLRSPRRGVGTPRATLRIRRFGQILVASQAGLAFVLTLGGTLIVTSLWRVWQVHPGYETDHVAVVRVSVRASGPRSAEVISDVMRDFERVPGVEAVGVMGSPLMTHSRAVTSIQEHENAKPLDVHVIYMSGDVPAVLQLAPVQGRLLTRDEIDREAPAVLLSARAAEALWPRETVVGRTLVHGQTTVTVVGVVPDARYSGLVEPARPMGQVYVARAGLRQKAFLVRTTKSPRDVVPALVSRLASRAEDFDLLWTGTLKEALGASIAERRLSAWIYGGIAVVALAITAVAVFGILAMTTSLRTREIGVRRALGATRWSVVTVLLSEQLGASLAGLAGGGVVAAWLAGLLRRELYGIAPTHPAAWTATAVIVVAIMALSSVIPAIRASRLDPAITLRAE